MDVKAAHAAVKKYQIFAYQEAAAPPTVDLWKSVGAVNALKLPMACTLTQFQAGHKYHFSVRAEDEHGRVGDFCQAQTVLLT